jgi:hypothetical protein
MTISKFRSRLYGAAKVLGDVQAVSKASRKQSFGPILTRIARRLAGKLTGRLLGRLFR